MTIIIVVLIVLVIIFSGRREGLDRAESVEPFENSRQAICMTSERINLSELLIKST